MVLCVVGRDRVDSVNHLLLQRNGVCSEAVLVLEIVVADYVDGKLVVVEHGRNDSTLTLHLVANLLGCLFGAALDFYGVVELV